MKTIVTPTALKKKSRISVATKLNSNNKWWNRLKGTGTFGDTQIFKIKTGLNGIVTTSNQKTVDATVTAIGVPATVNLLKQYIFTSKANRVKLGYSDQK